MNHTAQIEKWKEEEIENNMNHIAFIENQIKEWKAEYGFREMNRMEDYKRIANQTIEMTKMNQEQRLEAVTNAVDKHFENLQKKVVDKIGTIKEIFETGSNGADYEFKGENGNCEIRVINAGGWNIQKKHTRWMIMKK